MSLKKKKGKEAWDIKSKMKTSNYGTVISCVHLGEHTNEVGPREPAPKQEVEHRQESTLREVFPVPWRSGVCLLEIQSEKHKATYVCTFN